MLREKVLLLQFSSSQHLRHSVYVKPLYFSDGMELDESGVEIVEGVGGIALTLSYGGVVVYKESIVNFFLLMVLQWFERLR